MAAFTKNPHFSANSRLAGSRLFQIALRVVRAPFKVCDQKSMSTFTEKMSLGAVFFAWCLLPALEAGQSPREDVSWADTNARWTLCTADTSLKLSVSNNRVYIDGLKNPAQDWNWVPTASEVPLPGRNSIRTGNVDQTPNWKCVGATEDKSDGDTVTLLFTSTMPALELKSVWSAKPGPGPVENQVTIENKTGQGLVYSPDISANVLRLRADKSVNLWSFEKTSQGQGRVGNDLIAPGLHFTKDSRYVPLIMLDVGANHGAYIGFEWELGAFQIASGSDPLDIIVSVLPITEPVSRGPNEVFTIPNVYYGTYKGDIDDGSNRFKKWFWNYKITRTLHDHADEPWTEVCMQVLGGNGSASVTGATPQSAYDALAATGVECVKFDFWDGSGKCWYTDRDWMFHHEVWPKGFVYAAKAHKAGLQAALYMGGTYQDCDLTTKAGRDAELAAILERYDKGWFDIWRSDFYTAPEEPMPQTYNGVANFLSILDDLIKSRPGFRYEDCCNGGKYKGFAICRRMTFCTMNDRDNDASLTRTTYYCNSYPINPVQLKSDLGPADSAYNLRTDMMGSILTWAVDNPLYRQHIALYKTRQRPILRAADVYHILPMADGTNWDGLEYFNVGLNKGSVFLFKPSPKAVDGDSKVIKLKGLEKDQRYTLTFQDRITLNRTMTGHKLMEIGIKVDAMTGTNASEIIWVN